MLDMILGEHGHKIAIVAIVCYAIVEILKMTVS